jgi:hypothetical protein
MIWLALIKQALQNNDYVMAKQWLSKTPASLYDEGYYWSAFYYMSADQ